MCAALSSYARACAAKGVMLWGWREHVCSESRAPAGLPVPAVPPWQSSGEGMGVTSSVGRKRKHHCLELDGKGRRPPETSGQTDQQWILLLPKKVLSM